MMAAQRFQSLLNGRALRHHTNTGFRFQETTQHDAKERVVVEQQQVGCRHQFSSSSSGSSITAVDKSTAKQLPWRWGSYCRSPWNARTNVRERYRPRPDACAPG